MDECEALGDRIAILRTGALVCAGSALYLQRRFGVGYTLVLAAPQAPSSNGVESHTLPSPAELLVLLRRFVPEAESADAGVPWTGEAARFSLPSSASPHFAALLRALASAWPGETSLTVTSMEDVFVAASAGGSGDHGMLLADGHEHGGSDCTHNDARGRGAKDTAVATPCDSDPGCAALEASAAAAFNTAPEAQRLRGLRLLTSHCSAMTAKRLAMLLGGWRLAVCISFVPAIFLVVAVMLSSIGLQTQLSALESAPPALDLGLSTHPASVPVFAFKAGTGVASDAIAAISAASPPGAILPGLISFNPSAAASAYPDVYGLVKPASDNVTRDLQLFEAAIIDVSARIPSSPPSVAIAWRGVGTLFSTQDAASAPPAGRVATFDAFSDPDAEHAAPIAFNLVSTQLFRVAVAAAQNTSAAALNPAVALQVSSHPLPASAASIARVRTSLIEGDAPFVILAMVIGAVIIPAVAAGALGREIEVGAKQQQLRAGASPSAFWAVAWLFDAAPTAIAVAVTMGTVAALGSVRTALASTVAGQRDAVAVLLLLYFPAALAANYALSTAVRRAQAAAVVSLGLGVIGGILAVVQNSLRGASATCDLALRAGGVLRFILPSFALAEGLIAAATLESLGTQLAACGRASSAPISALSAEATGAPLLALGIMALVWLAFAYCVDAVPRAAACRKAALRVQLWWHGGARQVPPPLSGATSVPDDEGVAAERGRVAAALLELGASPAAPAGLLFDRVRKVYEPGAIAQLASWAAAAKQSTPRALTALDSLSVAVPAGFSFGLIGANGAGKSTALGVASGSLLPTSGRAVAAGLDVSLADAAAVGAAVGFCPQYDPLISALTAEEHLTLYARIAGVPGAAICGAVRLALRDCDLMRHAHTPASAMSGGTKRKLCVATALIGRPRILLLDEPTAGVDLEARRILWRAMGGGGSPVNAGSTARMLTTHSVEEAEALCDRVGVLLAGRLRCIGTSAHLRTRFARFLRADIKLRPPDEATVDALVAAAMIGSNSIASVTSQALPAVLAAMAAAVATMRVNWPPTAELARLSVVDLGISVALPFERPVSGPGLRANPSSGQGLGRRLDLGRWSPGAAAPQHCVSLHDVALWLGERAFMLEARAVLAAALPGSEVMEAHGLTLRLSVPVDGGPGGAAAAAPTSLAGLFTAMVEATGAAHIESFSLGRVSLEAVVAEILAPSSPQAAV